MARKNRIMLVDDHEIFRKGLMMTISNFRHSEVVAEAEDGSEFLERFEQVNPDMVLMDIEMPVMGGIVATRIALERNPSLKIVALSMFGEDRFIEEMIAAGAKGYLIKNISKQNLDRAMKVISEGKNYYSEELWAYFSKKLTSRELDDKFSKRELEVLDLVCRGMTNEEIAGKLFISERTVIGHKSKLISKTDSKNTLQLISYAIRNHIVEI